MQELLSLVLDQLRNVWRFRWIALAMAWVIALVGWLYVYSLPDQYSASARVHIDTKSAIDPLLKGMAVTPNADQQANLLIRTVLSRPHLREIARSTGMDLKVTSDEQEQALIQGLQQRLKINSTGGKTDLYTISYTSSQPKLAQSVVQQVMSIMTTMNLENSNRNNTKQAVSFLSREVDKFKSKLDQTEKKLAQFKKSHAELMPGTSDYVSQVQQLNASLDSLQDQLAGARDREANIRQQMRTGGGPTRVSPAQSQQVQRIDQQLQNQQQRLSQLLTKYTPQHPDVIAAKRQIADLKKRRSDTLSRLRAHPNEIQGTTSAGGGSGLLAGQLNDTKVKISTLESSLKRKQQQLKKLEAGADNMNDAQAKLAQLSRNYDVTKAQYQKLLSRLYSARLSTDVQKHSEALEFRVIDPPDVPAKPSGPKRNILIAMALAGAVVAGIAFALFLAQIRPVFSSRRSLTDSTGLPVIGSVSLALTPAQRASRRASMLLYIVCCISLVIGFAAAIVLAPIGAHWVPDIVSGQVL